MRLNSDQQSAFKDIINFINSDEKYYFISGDAGTGKTFLISHIANNILKYANKNCSINRVEVTATTNKAAAVISSALKGLTFAVKTIYSFMNLRLTENHRTGEVKVVPTKNWQVHNGVLIIIDECSMANKELLKWLEEGTDKTCKVLFIGDKNQLAPVKENISQAFSQGYGSSWLTQMIRNSGSPALMDLCTQAKETVITGVFTPITEVPGVIDFVSGQNLKGLLERDYSFEHLDRRVLCYTNKQVTKYNEFIREIRGYSDPFVVGEILTNNAPVQLLGKRKLYTDQTLQVRQVLRNGKDTELLAGETFETIELVLEDVSNGEGYQVVCFRYPEERVNLISYFAKNKIWVKYFKVKNNFPDLRPVAASTTHKAQGSTYDSVIVDLSDIGKASVEGQVARMQYVALSRAKSRVFIKGKLPERFFKS